MWKNAGFLAIEEMQMKTKHIIIHHLNIFLMIKKKMILARLSIFLSCFSKDRAKRTINPLNLSEVQFGNM